MFFWKKKKSADVINTPVTNPGLKKAFQEFGLNKSEETLQKLRVAINSASFLVLVESDGLKLTPGQTNTNVTMETGSTMKFMRTHNEHNQWFLPIFTDWHEIDLWTKTREGFVGLVVPISDVFTLVNNSNDYGFVINPCSDRWNMNKAQIALFIKESEPA